MFHPLISDASELKVPELEHKINDLTRKYFIAMRGGHPDLGQQILVALETYKEALHQKHLENSKVTTRNGDTDLDDLINIS